MLKTLVHAVALVCTAPAALLCGFGRIRFLYGTFAQMYALMPGLPGDYLRIAFYRLTLQRCSLSSRISFGSFFAHPEACLEQGVYIGSYCVLGRVAIGARTQIASGVQILSGKNQHARDAGGRITGSDQGVFMTVTIGPDCWIGAAAIVMADVGAGTTVGAGAVVTKPLPANVTAVGNPARVIQRQAGEQPD